MLMPESTVVRPQQHPDQAFTSSWIDLDLAQEHVLDDHRVHGIPLLPTVMAVDALVWAAPVAAAGDGTAAPIEIHDLVVGPPVLFDAGPRRHLELRTVAGAGVHCELRADAADGGALHYAASISRAPSTVPLRRRTRYRFPAAGGLPISAGAIYPPYFHGPQLQVIDGARVDEHGVLARLSAVPPLSWSTRQTVTAPTLLELCLQACGLWDLTRTGAMMIPDRIDRIVVVVPEASLGSTLRVAEARVTPIVNADGRTSFDGVVVDGHGRLLLEVHGYHTVDLPVDLDPAAAS